MKNYLEKFKKMVDELNQHPKIIVGYSAQTDPIRSLQTDPSF